MSPLKKQSPTPVHAAYSCTGMGLLLVLRPDIRCCSGESPGTTRARRYLYYAGPPSIPARPPRVFPGRLTFAADRNFCRREEEFACPNRSGMGNRMPGPTKTSVSAGRRLREKSCLPGCVASSADCNRGTSPFFFSLVALRFNGTLGALRGVVPKDTLTEAACSIVNLLHGPGGGVCGGSAERADERYGSLYPA